MDTREAIVARIRELCNERNITPNALSIISAVPQSTVKSILNGESSNPGAVTMGTFFSTPEFDALEQEIR